MKIKKTFYVAALLSGIVSGCSTAKHIDTVPDSARQPELAVSPAQTIKIPYPATAATYEVRVYMVQVADSLEIISAKLHVTKEELATLNSGTNLQALKIGQRLVFFERTSPYTY